MMGALKKLYFCILYFVFDSCVVCFFSVLFCVSFWRFYLHV